MSVPRAETERSQFASYIDNECVSHRVHGLHFDLYTDEEISRLSLKNINQLETFDCLSHSTAGGLHDLELGLSIWFFCVC